MAKSFKIDWCSHEAAKYACENWHYSKCLPVGKLVKVGVWEEDKFIGCVIFSRGANKDLLKPFGLELTQGCELTRIALCSHKTPVSRIMIIAIKFLKRFCSELRLIVSFADAEQGHHGGIYQATNWIYTGRTIPADEYMYQGKRWHGRAFRKSYGSHLPYLSKGLKIVKGSSKHRYLFGLDEDMKRLIEARKKPYPKRAQSKENVVMGVQPVEGGVIPTCVLQ